MITVKARSLFKNRVGIRDKYVNEAMNSNDDLRIVYLNEEMIIPHDDIAFEIVARSKEAFPDQFSNEFHYLVYFRWKPTTYQKKLI